MKTILCFGDSNTWGWTPASGFPNALRFDFHHRWPGVLQDSLGAAFRVLEDGLNGRTTVWDDPIWEGRNGRKQLPLSLEMHSPLDLVILMLGTNDLQVRYSASAFAIADGAAALVRGCLEFTPRPKHVLLVSPVRFRSTDDTETMNRFEGGVEKSAKLAEHYAYFAKSLGCHFFDAATVAEACLIDGVHMDQENHLRLGRGMAERAKEIFLHEKQ